MHLRMRAGRLIYCIIFDAYDKKDKLLARDLGIKCVRNIF